MPAHDGNQSESSVVVVGMDTMKAVTKALAIAFALALFATACGSGQSEVASGDNAADEQAAEESTTTTEEPTTDDEPPEGFRRFTFTFSPEDVVADVYGGDLSTFEVRSASGDETIIVGFLDETGTIDIPNDIAQGTIGVEAEFPDDEFCWWSGFYTSNNAAKTLTVEVELDEICA